MSEDRSGAYSKIPDPATTDTATGSNYLSNCGRTFLVHAELVTHARACVDCRPEQRQRKQCGGSVCGLFFDECSQQAHLVSNALAREGCKSPEDVRRLSDEELSEIRLIGRSRVAYIRRSLKGAKPFSASIGEPPRGVIDLGRLAVAQHQNGHQITGTVMGCGPQGVILSAPPLRSQFLDYSEGWDCRVIDCPTCCGTGRETVGMVCQTCGTDYGGQAPPRWWLLRQGGAVQWASCLSGESRG